MVDCTGVIEVDAQQRLRLVYLKQIIPTQCPKPQMLFLILEQKTKSESLENRSPVVIRAESILVVYHGAAIGLHFRSGDISKVF